MGLCAFSGYKIYPGHNKRYVKADGKTFNFLGSKCSSAYMMKKNPRKVNWTVLYRRKHKKGIEVETFKKRSRRTVVHQRAIVGASLADIMAKKKKREKLVEKKAQKTKTDKKKTAKPVAKNVQ